jgi:chromosome segregation ATPase
MPKYDQLAYWQQRVDELEMANEDLRQGNDFLEKENEDLRIQAQEHIKGLEAFRKEVQRLNMESLRLQNGYSTMESIWREAENENSQLMDVAGVLAAEITELKESLIAEGLEAAKVFMETETVKVMQREIARLRDALDATEAVKGFMTMPKGYWEDQWSDKDEAKYETVHKRYVEAKQALKEV